MPEPVTPPFLSWIAATDCLLVPGCTMRFAFLCRGNRRGPRSNPPREVSQKSRAPFGRYSRLWLALTTAADCSPTLIITELRLTIEEANAIRQLVPPEAFNAVRRQRRVTRRVPEIAVPDIRLRRQRVDAVLSSLTLQTCRSI